MRVVILFLLFFPLFGCRQTGSQEKIFQVVDQMPQFPGGQDSLLHYIISHTNYPDDCKRKGIEGTVYVQFLINCYGTVTDVKVLRNIDPALDAEAYRVVSHFPKWKPGENGGKKVSVYYTVPVHFSLK